MELLLPTELPMAHHDAIMAHMQEASRNCARQSACASSEKSRRRTRGRSGRGRRADRRSPCHHVGRRCGCVRCVSLRQCLEHFVCQGEQRQAPSCLYAARIPDRPASGGPLMLHEFLMDSRHCSRMTHLNEMLQSVRFTKYYAMEEHYQNQMLKSRAEEERGLRAMKYTLASVWPTGSVFIS